MNLSITNVHLDLGAGRRGTDMGPSAIHVAGLVPRLKALGHTIVDVTSLGGTTFENTDSGDPKARFLPQIVRICTKIAARVEADVLEGRVPLVLGGGYTGVTSVRPRPDAAFVAYTADQELRGEIELFVSPSATPGASTQISVEPSATTLAGEVFSHQPAPGGRVLFTARQESPNYVGLYTVRTAGGDLRRLSGRSAPVPVLPQGRVALGAGYAVFQGARALDAGFEPAGLYAVALDGSAEPFALHAPLPEDGAVLDFVLSSDGTQVFFRGDLAGDDQFPLYRAPIDGSAAAVELSAPARATTSLFSVTLSPDGSRVAFVADRESADEFAAGDARPGIKVHRRTRQVVLRLGKRPSQIQQHRRTFVEESSPSFFQPNHGHGYCSNPCVR